MSQLFAAFGIDWRLLVINVINFSALFAVLSYFLYRPLTSMLAVRRERVAEGMRAAEDAMRERKELADARAGMLASAGAEADDVLSKARASALLKSQEIVSAGEVSAENLLKDAEARSKELQAEALRESKQEVAKLIVLGIERLGLEKK